MLGLYEKMDFTIIYERSDRYFFGARRFILDHKKFFGDRKIFKKVTTNIFKVSSYFFLYDLGLSAFETLL